MSTEDKDLLNLQGCIGHLKWGKAAENQFPITFDLKLQKSGRGLIEISTSNPAANVLSTLLHETEAVRILADGPEGESIDVLDADVSNFTAGYSRIEQRSRISLTITVRRMSVYRTEIFKSTEGEPKRVTEYLLKGLERTLGFSARLAPWKVSVNSEIKAQSPDTVSASMVIELDDEAADCLGQDNFMAKCDELAQRVLEVLSVSVGTSLAWSVRKTSVDGLPINLFFRSTQVVIAPAYPMFYGVNLRTGA